MNRVNFARCSGVVVDVCKAHGTWFDRDELRRIVEFIRAGGLEQARAFELDQLERERRALTAERQRDAIAWDGSNYADHHVGIAAVASTLLPWFD